MGNRLTGAASGAMRAQIDGGGAYVSGAGTANIAGWVTGAADIIGPALPIATYGTSAEGTGTIWLCPIVVSSARVATHVVFENTAGTPNVRCGIWRMDTGALMSESVSTALGGSAVNEVALAAAQTLVPGINYLAGFESDAAITMREIATVASQGFISDFPQTAFYANQLGTYQVTHTYGALPNPVGTLVSTSSASAGPWVGIRVSS